MRCEKFASAVTTSLLIGTILALFAAPASAQLGNPNPAINLTCEGEIVEIDVSPGASRVGSLDCLLENPSIHQEDVNISVDEIDLQVSYPNSISVAPNSDTTFTVSWAGEIGAPVASFSTIVEATVTTVNGLPYPLGESKSESVTVDILPFGRPWIDISGQELALEHGQSSTVNFSLRNTGNAEDTLRVTIENQSGLEQFGFTFDYSATSARLGVNESEEITLTITASEEILDGSFVVILQATSEMAEDDGEPWVVEENFRLQSLAKEESFLTTSVDSVPAWAITTTMVLAGLAVVGVIVVAVRVMLSKRGGMKISGDSAADVDFEFDDEEFADFELDDL